MASARTPSPPRPARVPAAAPHRPRGEVRRSRNGKRRAWALAVVHLLVLAHVAHWLATGSTLTPLEPSEAGQALEVGVVNAGFVLFALLLASTAVLGRWFCGWACHVVAYQDAAAWLLAKLGLRPKPVRSRVMVWVPLLTAFVMFFLPGIVRLWLGLGLPEMQLQWTTETYWERFPGVGVALLTFLVCGGILVWFLGAKGFCTYGCPYGALFGIADKFARGRIRVTDACEGCGHCTATCTSNVQVHQEVALYEMVVDPGCMKCLDCVSVCPKDALYYGDGKSALGATPARKPPAKKYDFSIGEEVVMLVVFLLSTAGIWYLSRWLPILLTVGVAVLTAFGTIALARMVRGAVQWQHHDLRGPQGVTLTGAVVALGSLGLVAYSGVAGVNAYGVYEQVQGTRAFNQASQIDPADPARLRKLDEMDAHLARAESFLWEANPELHYMIGTAQGVREKFDASAERMRAAIALAPDIDKAHFQLVNVLNHQRQLDACLAAHETWLESLRSRGRLSEDGEFRDIWVGRAADVLARVLTANPGHEETTLRLAELFAELGRSDELIRNVLAPLLENEHVPERAARILEGLRDARD